MNNCSKCGKELISGEKFCQNCVSDLSQAQVNQQINQPVSQQVNEELQQNVYHQPIIQPDNQQFNQESNQYIYYQPLPKRDIDEKDPAKLDYNLMHDYIGNNSGKIMNSRFSFPSLFFTAVYLVYRKMYLFGFALWMIQLSLVIFLLKYSNIIIILIGFILAFAFRSLYLNKVKTNVKKIIRENPSASYDELAMISSAKGGVNGKITLFLCIVMIIFSTAITSKVGIINRSGITSNNDRLVCKAEKGNLTVYYNSDGVVGYESKNIDFDFDENVKISKKVEMEIYLKSVTSWFERNLSGTCKIEKKK